MNHVTPGTAGSRPSHGPAEGSLGFQHPAPDSLPAVPKSDQTSVSPPRPTATVPTPLAELAELLGLAPVAGGTASGITHDSRAVRPGDVYVAFAGANHHGAAFAAGAVAAGAAAVLTDPAGAELAGPLAVPVLVVEQPRAWMGRLAARIHGEPSRALLTIGITGTNGKTTTSYLVEAGLKGAGRFPGVIGTVEMRVGEERIKSERTTPEATDLHAILAVMRERGADSVVMEVSSHALVYGRVDGVQYDVAVFNNLTPEHLDFHPDMEDYYRAKARLFEPGRSNAAVVNLDDAYGRRLAGETALPVTTFSAAGDPAADWRAVDVRLGPATSAFTVVGPDGRSVRAEAPLPGPFNVSNALAAITALVTAGLPLEQAAAGVAAAPGVPGRLERVEAGQEYVAVVDYAHKPDALKAVLSSLREVTKGRLHVVVGCGGDRDPYKRGPMGAIAAQLADTAVLTSDNPRSEDALAILASMLSGAAEVPESERGEVLVVPDRAEAIADAVARAHPGDTVLVAGKGHELGQYVKGEVRPFDDREVLREAIAHGRPEQRGVEQR
ncbi:UDP-N-acetylmuramoyl-L-alanyl-D-glutamate--2,6-diaminopimelate ligase [Kitasatospora sp. NPDC006697]|uniref:UDP-N-acetylmuramoyl-L-alanyl-D-glutamate--2, 6-diaminopimelate ligase n=1 Tax=Kitasatospora sp. NPDC006697 TaxID=3364020 RepID=UPI0036A705C8